jgi:crotonobetainyl-CoA:carnitine CoA-transferase CaiB-like acyl-CoA transferase
LSPLLDGVRVLDFSGRLGAACGAFLASLGAQVCKVQGPGGDASRRLADGSEDPAWLARNLGKRIVRLDLDTAGDQAVARRLASAADMVIESFPPQLAETRGLDHPTLAAANPGLISVSITPFGRSGPYRAWAGGELVCSAMGGTLAVTGYEDRAPVKEAADACIFHAAGVAAQGALFALYERRRSGLGQQVDVSVQDVAASRCTNGVLLWQFDNRLLPRTGAHISYGAARVRIIWELADGFCFHGLMSGRIGAPANAALSAWMNEAGFDNPMRDVDWIAYNRSTLPADVRAVWEAAIDRFFRSRTKAEIAHEGGRRGVNAVVANSPGEVLADPHLNARDFFGEVEGGVMVPRRFVSTGEVHRAPLAPVEISADAAVAAWPIRARAIPRSAVAAGPAAQPLAGVKVLDFSWALVGSFTGKALADFGATVVKVESSTRPCLSRIDVQVKASRPGQFDDKPWFIHMNTSKLGLRLNMKHPRWREVIDPLLDWADVVLENFSPGTMAGFGLDYETLKARRPDLIMVSGSVYGQTGPLAREWGVDGTGAALSGRLLLTGWPDRPPVTPSAVPYGDVVLPPFMAASVAAALDRRARTGEGRHIDASMYEVCVQQMAGPLIAAQHGRAPARMGERDAAVLFQGVYPTRGDDRWIAISIQDESHWECLRAAMGWADGPALSAADPARLDAVDARIGAWTASRDGQELMAMLQSAGVPAGVAQTAADLVDSDPQLRARGFLEQLDNPVLGAFGHQAQPVKLSRTPSRMTTAPGLGQHTEMICRQFAGLSAEAYADLLTSDLFE